MSNVPIARKAVQRGVGRGVGVVVGEWVRVGKMYMSFFDRTRERYLELASNDESIVVVSAEQSMDSVAQDIRTHLTNWLAQ